MKYSLVAPPLPRVKRWIDLNRRFPTMSTLRQLEYEKLVDTKITGSLLDLGGGVKSSYWKYLPDDIEYSSVNIDPDYKPTWLVEPGDPLPIEDHTFDACMSMNTLEHVYDPKVLVREMHRILKPGGVMHLTVPWIFRMHQQPDDFTRTTHSWWRVSLEEIGFSEAEVTPLVWGQFSTATSICGFRGLFPKTRKHITHIKDVLYASCLFRNTGGRYTGRRGEKICNIALGYFISATK